MTFLIFPIFRVLHGSGHNSQNAGASHYTGFCLRANADSSSNSSKHPEIQDFMTTLSVSFEVAHFQARRVDKSNAGGVSHR
jgi:hypothetical protein